MALVASHSSSNEKEREPKKGKLANGKFVKNILPYSKVEHLIDQIYVDALNGESRYHIKRKIMEGGYEGQTKGLSDRQAESYISAVKQRIKNDFADKHEDARNLLMGRFEAVYNDSQILGDHHAAIRALENIGKIIGAYNSENPTIQVNTDNKGITINFGFANNKEEDVEEENA